MTRGVYMIRNKKTGQLYIGQSNNIERRWKEHCSLQDIDKAIYDNGVDNFSIEVLEEIPVLSDVSILEREKYWIEKFDTMNDSFHYNAPPIQYRNDNTSGYYRVSKVLSKKYKQGFYWRYNWRENGKYNSIKRVNFKDLQREVKKRGLPWVRFK